MSDEIRLAGLQATVNDADILREWLKHPGYQIAKKHIESKIEFCRKTWLQPNQTSQQLEKVRHDAMAYQELLNFLTTKILQGDYAKQYLTEQGEEVNE